jgi:acyl-CoA reductase-like NAD-dependent aldehyde dehydrogenase
MTTLEYDKFFIGGEWRKPSGSDRITVINASTEEVLGSVPEGQQADIDAAVAAARTAFDDPTGWAHWDEGRRADAMLRLADALEARMGEIAQLVSQQNGMVISLAKQLEGGVPVAVLRYYANMIRETGFEEVRQGLFGGTINVRRDPVGVVAAIVPWNVPQTLAAAKYAPALAAGCTVVIKPSPETVLDSVVLAEAIAEAGIPAGVINIVPAGREVGAYLVQHPGIDKVAFTGSTAAGRHIASVCGQLLRPVSLELGGKSAAIILEDADLDATIGEDFYLATLLNNGQACLAGTRILAPRSRYEDVVDALGTFVGGLSIGDPLDPQTRFGPLASPRQRERVEGYIAKGKAEGSRVVVGGGRPSGLDRGWYVEPTVFADVDNQQVIAQEEIFGPVLSVIAYNDEADAVRIANDTDYGLGGSVWTSDPEHGLEVARQMQTGSVGINQYSIDPVAPFGGVKASGLGREFGREGLHDYQQYKSISRR